MKQLVKMLAWAGLLNPSLFLAQGFAKIAKESESATTSIITIGKNSCRAALAIGIIFVIYALADNKNYAKIAVISWCVGLAFYLIAFELLKS